MEVGKKGGRNGGTGKEAGMEVLEWRQGCRYWNGGRDGGTGKEAGMEGAGM
jgi:hypothetical protein